MNYSELAKVTPKRELYSERRRFPGEPGLGRVCIRFDDCCGNGQNSFAITVDARDYGGCMHTELAEVFPEYAYLIPFHNMDTRAPMHYVANTVYHAENGDLEYARSTAIAPTATLEQLKDKDWLLERLPRLVQDFAAAMSTIDWESGQ
jgi:hypothetical protein